MGIFDDVAAASKAENEQRQNKRQADLKRLKILIADFVEAAVRHGVPVKPMVTYKITDNLAHVTRLIGTGWALSDGSFSKWAISTEGDLYSRYDGGEDGSLVPGARGVTIRTRLKYGAADQSQYIWLYHPKPADLDEVSAKVSLSMLEDSMKSHFRIT